MGRLRRRALAASLCTTLLWWVPGSPSLPVTAEPVEPVLDQAETPTAITLAVASASSATAPVVVSGGRAASVGMPSDASSPRRTVGPTVVGEVVLDAYRLAAMVAPDSCNLDVSLLAAIGQVESGNLAGYELDADHRPDPPVLGPVLDGSSGVAAIPDTDAGQWDGDREWDRAVGPMQFIPSSWRVAGVDMDADGERNPQDVEDAAGAAMVYLCVGGVDLSDEASLRSAIFGYNHSDAYVRLVLAWKKAFDSQGLELDLAEPPPIRLTAVQYGEVTRSVRASAARTVDARDLADGSGKGAGDAGGADEKAGEKTDEKDAFGTWPEAVRDRGGKSRPSTPSASPSPGKPSPSQPAATASGPASSGPGSTGSGPASPSGSDAPAKTAAADGPSAKEPAKDPAPSATGDGPSTSPAPSPLEELVCPTPTPTPATGTDPAGTTSPAPAGEPPTDPTGPASVTPTPGDAPATGPCDAAPGTPSTSPSAPAPSATDPVATDPAP